MESTASFQGTWSRSALKLQRKGSWSWKLRLSPLAAAAGPTLLGYVCRAVGMCAGALSPLRSACVPACVVSVAEILCVQEGFLALR